MGLDLQLTAAEAAQMEELMLLEVRRPWVDDDAYIRSSCSFYK
jgi:hypothetical protein